MTSAEAFGPHAALAAALMPHAAPLDDGAHDLSHILRVWRNVQVIAAAEGGDGDVLAAATLLHDCVAIEKDAPDRHLASTRAAQHARGLLHDHGWSSAQIDAVAHAIVAHSYSAAVAPETLEAKILQDADRLDAIGLIGVARCFHVGGRLGRALYAIEDPLAHARTPDDTRFSLDHFRTKLLGLAAGFQTRTGQELASERHQRMLTFLDQLGDEIGAAG